MYPPLQSHLGLCESCYVDYSNAVADNSNFLRRIVEHAEKRGVISRGSRNPSLYRIDSSDRGEGFWDRFYVRVYNANGKLVQLSVEGDIRREGFDPASIHLSSGQR
jgi:hypothetical protein